MTVNMVTRHTNSSGVTLVLTQTQGLSGLSYTEVTAADSTEDSKSATASRRLRNGSC